MPELPEVETVLRGLRARALGRRITTVEVRHPGAIAGDATDFVRSVEGRVIKSLERKGKALAVSLVGSDGEPPQFLLIRLGMTGQITVGSAAAPVETHTHVRLSLDDGREEVRFRDPRRFGRLRCCTQGELRAVFGKLGPDAQLISEEQFGAAMRGRRGAIKSWLMNQQMLAGLGNIYADEALFLARIHPLAQPGNIPMEKARALYRAVKRVLKLAVELQGTSFRDYIDIEGRPGNYTPRLRVYQRTGEPCRRCKQPIRRLVIAGRSSHFCPRCQPRPRQVAGLRGPRSSRAAKRAAA
ncbi:MAG: bifunctional DNA-formamidopyrimidine glycosylase/DNA-(apurinic or apyrimidinic site) lyase [Terriglobia bacterium]